MTTVLLASLWNAAIQLPVSHQAIEYVGIEDPLMSSGRYGFSDPFPVNYSVKIVLSLILGQMELVAPGGKPI